jgi:hypothetical protein
LVPINAPAVTAKLLLRSQLIRFTDEGKEGSEPMDQNELIFLGAALLLSRLTAPRAVEIQAAVEQARALHEEVKKQCATSATIGVVEWVKQQGGEHIE